MRLELLPVALVGGLAIFVAAQALGGTSAAAAGGSSRDEGSDRPAATSSIGADGAGFGAGRAGFGADGAAFGADRASPEANGAPSGTTGAASRDTERAARELRSTLLALSSDTYLARVIADGENMLTRWRTDAPVRVWVSPTSTLRGWHPRMVSAAREAFDDWRGTVPVDFRFVEDSASAQVVITWRDSFQPDSRSGGLVGHARRHYTPSGWIAAAEVSLAVHAVDGSPLSPELIRAAALHEAGHVIGLPHSDQQADIMAPSHSGVVTRLSARDVRTAQELYGMMPGRVR